MMEQSGLGRYTSIQLRHLTIIIATSLLLLQILTLKYLVMSFSGEDHNEPGDAYRTEERL